MTTIPDRRRSPEELLEDRQVRVAVAPNAAFARQLGKRDVPLSVGDWLITLIVLAIPILNIVLYVYWAFFSNGNQGRINFCRASLILTVIGLFIMLIFGAL